jgi:hypothetical protein
LLLKERECAGRVTGSHDLEAGLLQHLLQETAGHAVIFND